MYGSVGFIFGVIVYDPNARCLMRSVRVLTISSASKEPECITFSTFQDWCSKLTNATEVTKANNRITTSVEIPVQSLYNVTYMYNGTTNNPVILLYWMPKFYGQDSNKGYRQCIVQVHILGKCYQCYLFLDERFELLKKDQCIHACSKILQKTSWKH